MNACILIAGMYWLQITGATGPTYMNVNNIDTISDSNIRHIIYVNNDMVSSPIPAAEVMELLKTCPPTKTETPKK